MVAEAVASGIQASHLLFDSWFAYPVTDECHDIVDRFECHNIVDEPIKT
jgi:hypothetical protein